MPFHNLHDYDEDNIDVWYARIVKVLRVGEFWLDVGRGALVPVSATNFIDLRA